MGNVRAEHQRLCQKAWRSVGMLEEGQRVRTLLHRGEDLASALILRPHCRNQVSSILESGNAEVWESGGAEAWESRGAEGGGYIKGVSRLITN